VRHSPKKNIVIKFVPKRLTNLLQPADVMWFASIKMSYGEKWNEWFIFDEKKLTPHGNMVSPGYAKTIQWLSDIWNEFDSTVIVDSFRKCGKGFFIIFLSNIFLNIFKNY